MGLISLGVALIATPHFFQGHAVRYPLTESTVEYRITGSVFRKYVGGRDAPEVRTADLSGVLVVKTRVANLSWVAEGFWKTLVITQNEVSISKEDHAKAVAGKWTIALPSGSPFYTINGKPAIPNSLSLAAWPFCWLPLTATSAMKIGDEFTAPFSLPLQSFLEDDPIGIMPISLRFRFQGPEREQVPVYQFDLVTSEVFNKKIKHPEDNNLTLTGNMRVTGAISLSRDDGRLESGRLMAALSLGLNGPKYDFGFSKSDSSVSAMYQRIR